MIAENQYVEIARRLLDKTNQGMAKWEAVQKDHSRFVLKLPVSRIVIRYDAPVAEFDRITLEICGREGDVLAAWSVSEGEPHWNEAMDLFTTVKRQFFGWDKVLQDVEAFLQIGKTSS